MDKILINPRKPGILIGFDEKFKEKFHPSDLFLCISIFERTTFPNDMHCVSVRFACSDRLLISVWVDWVCTTGWRVLRPPKMSQMRRFRNRLFAVQSVWILRAIRLVRSLAEAWIAYFASLSTECSRNDRFLSHRRFLFFPWTARPDRGWTNVQCAAPKYHRCRCLSMSDTHCRL